VKKVLYIVSNVFPTILPTHAFYTSPSLHTTLPPIYTLPITPRFHSFPTLHFATLFYTLDDFYFTSLHFLSLHFLIISRTLYFSLTHLNNRFPSPFFFKVFGLQGRVPNTSAGSWFQFEWSYSQRNISLYPSFASYS